jgi:hypothetical protein
MPKNLPIIESSHALLDSDSDVEKIMRHKDIRVPRHSNHDMKLDANDSIVDSKKVKTLIDRSNDKFQPSEILSRQESI